MNGKIKKLEVVAGPNGSGKTTFAKAYFRLQNGSARFINADVIALGLGNENEQAAFHAGRVMLDAVKEAMSHHESFSFESTLSGKTWFRVLERAKKEGYEITLYFVCLKSVKTNLMRIKKRVREGGHPIAKDTVLRRTPRSFQNFWNLYRPLCDNWFVFDNSGSKPKQIGSKDTFETMTDLEKENFRALFFSFGGLK